MISCPFPELLPLYQNTITNWPGMTIVALQVTFPPNGSTPSQTHAGAPVSVHIVSGYVLNKMNNQPMTMLGPTESFKWMPGCYHQISSNASATEPAQIVATMIVETAVVEKGGMRGLIVIEEEYRAIVEAKMNTERNTGVDTFKVVGR